MKTMTPNFRKLALTAHITSSVGWLGAVAGFLVLAIAGLTSQNAQLVRASYVAMELTAWFVIVPLSLASPITGLIQSLGTPWGLFRHYWLVAKLLITIPATLVLFLHLKPIGHLATAVAETTLLKGDLAGLRIKLVANAGAAVAVLLVAAAISVFKPWGLTRYGQRKQDAQFADAPASSTAETGDSTIKKSRWFYILLFIAIILVLLFVILHLTGGGLGGHSAHEKLYNYERAFLFDSRGVSADRLR